jgi:hypothetical protein
VLQFYASVADNEILTKLREALDAARQRSDAASQHFDEIIRDVPSGLPHPDGVERVRIASSEFIRSRQQLMEAHLKLESFIAHGTVPEEFLAPRKPATQTDDKNVNKTRRRS